MAYSFHFLTVLLTLFGFVILAQKTMKLPLQQAIPFVLATLISILYISGICNCFSWVSKGLYVMGLGGCVLASLHIVYKHFKDECPKSSLWSEVDGRSLLAWLLVVFVFYARVAPSYYSFWDDCLWGQLISGTYFNHGLTLPKGELTFVQPHMAHYGRLIGLVHAFFLQFIPFTEGHNLFIAGFLAWSFSSVILIKRSFGANVALLLVAVTPAVLSTPIFVSVYLDGLMGLLFGALIVLLMESELKWKRLALAIPFLIIMPNLKEVGYFLCYAGLLGFSFKAILCRESKRVIDWCMLSLLYLIPYISHQTWWIYLDRIKSAVKVKPKLSWMDLFNKTLQSAQSLAGLPINVAFIKAVCAFFIHPSMLATYGILLAAYVLTKKKQNNKLREFGMYLSIFFALFLGYMLYRYALYHVYFTYSDAIEAASAHRYFASFSLGFGFIGCFYIKQAFDRMSDKERAGYKKYVWIAGLIGFWAVGWGLAKRPHLQLPKERLQIQKIARDVYDLDLVRHRILVRFHETTIYGCHCFGHELMAMGVNDVSVISEQCFRQAKDGTSPIGEQFYKQLRVENFNDMSQGEPNPNKFDFFLLGNPTEEVLQKVQHKLRLALKPATTYVVFKEKGVFLQRK